MKQIQVKKLMREIDYRPLTDKTINNLFLVAAMVKRIQNIKPDERITYFSGCVGEVNRHDSPAAALWEQLKKFEHAIKKGKAEGFTYHYSAVFLSEKIEIHPGCNVFDYMVVGK